MGPSLFRRVLDLVAHALLVQLLLNGAGTVALAPQFCRVRLGESPFVQMSLGNGPIQSHLDDGRRNALLCQLALQLATGMLARP